MSNIYKISNKCRVLFKPGDFYPTYHFQTKHGFLWFTYVSYTPAGMALSSLSTDFIISKLKEAIVKHENDIKERRQRCTPVWENK